MRARDVSRRAACRQIGALAVATCGLAVSARADDYKPQKQVQLTKAAARYQDHPFKDQSCGSCPYLIAPAGCVVVEGDVSPNGWCPMYTQFSPLDRGAHT